MKHILHISLFCLLSVTSVRSQSGFRNWPISLTVGKANIATPLYKTLSKPYHLAIATAIEFNHKNGQSGKIFQTIHLGWFTTKYSHQGIQLSTALGYRYRTNFGLFLDAAIELGAQQSFHKTAIFKRTDAGYTKVKDNGTLFGLVGANVSLGYQIGSEDRPLDLFLLYRPTVLAFYPDIDVLPQEFISIGTRFSPFKNNKS